MKILFVGAISEYTEFIRSTDGRRENNNTSDVCYNNTRNKLYTLYQTITYYSIAYVIMTKLYRTRSELLSKVKKKS